MIKIKQVMVYRRRSKGISSAVYSIYHIPPSSNPSRGQGNLLYGGPLSTITLLVVYRSMRRNSVDTVVRIKVLMQGQLEDRS